MNIPASSATRTSRVWVAAGLLGVVIAWQFTAERLGPLLMATPLQTLQAIGPLVSSERFLPAALTSLVRAAIGIGTGCLCGFALGLMAAARAQLRGLLEPLRWLLMSIPAVVVVLLAMLWFGLGSSMVIFLTALMTAPGLYVNTVKGMQQVDRQLLEMTHVYRFGWRLRLEHLYIPALTAPLSAALLIAVNAGVRLVVMAEVLGADSGVGHALANARATFDSAELYAWVVLIVSFVGVLELALIQPLQRRLGRWQEVRNA
ncbi:ABC transporter permease [Diaphorobacter caeni]|uniref:ABC transporter permease n=1 Tax=Diaphorobacter caeni TaxID=2784387 RepID=UPI00188E6AAB|nr:ABC transporter permease subunit [Diaphorobacter caeni]MBF5005851.1 ABC transporter permease subunit [Diaphorobacter caeni]